METSTKFTNTELVFLISNLVMSKLFLVYPSSFAALGASASILLAFSTSVAGLILMLLLLKFCKKNGNFFKLPCIHKAKSVYAVILMVLFILNQGYFVRSVAESLKISILPKSPLFFIAFIYIAGVLICSHVGLKSIIRAHSFVTPFTIVLVLLLFISSINNFDFYNIFPIMGNGAKMFLYIPLLLAYFGDFIILMFIIPYSCENASIKKTVIPSYIISSLMLIIVISLYTLVIPNNTAGTFFIPVFKVAQYISYQSFMARMESVFTIGWMLSHFLTSATYLYISSMILGSFFKAKSNRIYMYLIAAVTLAVSFIATDTDTLVSHTNYFSLPRLILCIIIPLAAMGLAKHKEVNKK